MLSSNSLSIGSHTNHKDPFRSDLGERIVLEGIRLMNQIGFEAFTFKKLAHEIKSTEASVYRYFTNKHMFLIYISNLYWNWLEEKIRQLSYDKSNHLERLKKAIYTIVLPSTKENDQRFPFQELVDVIVSEGPKVYLTKLVDDENKEGVFFTYKSLCESISQLILNVNPSYEYSHSLASTIVESAHDQTFFSKHLPRLTDFEEADANKLNDFLVHTVTSAIQ